MIFKKITLPILLILGLLLQGSWTQAAILLTKAGTHSYAVPFAREDINLSGSAGSSEMTFHIPSYWEVGRVRLMLDVQTSAVSRKEWSTVTLFVNGNPFYSFHPETGTETGQRMEVSVPVELLAPGSNVLKLQTELRAYADDQVCEEDTEIGHWLRIGDSSRIET
ncbi:MAG: cellulose synthase, partial [Paenibacillaceae bacterium]|nr:cellulose synthase [Paenibacillaceae bacterium]